MKKVIPAFIMIIVMFSSCEEDDISSGEIKINFLCDQCDAMVYLGEEKLYHGDKIGHIEKIFTYSGRNELYVIMDNEQVGEFGVNVYLDGQELFSEHKGDSAKFKDEIVFQTTID